MLQHDHQIRIRYADVDQMGYVYYGHYARYYEIGRAEFLRSVGFPYKRLEDEGVMCPVASMKIRFLRAPRYDELITIRTTVKELPGKSVFFYMEVFLESGKLANAGLVKLAFVDAKTMKTAHAPESLLKVLKPHFD